MIKHPKLYALICLAILVSLVGGSYTPAAASSPTVGRSFRFSQRDSDHITVTLTENLPVTSADLYFDIVIDGSFYGWDVTAGQQVYDLDLTHYPDPIDSFEIWLGIYGTVTVNGVEQPTIDNELIQGVHSADLLISGPDPTDRFILGGSGAINNDPVLSMKWSTLEYIPGNWSGLTQAEIDKISADLAALTDVGIGFYYDQGILQLTCNSGSFTITPKVSLGPDNYVLGIPRTIFCPGDPDIRMKLSNGGANLANGGSFAFPQTDVAAPPAVQGFDICNDGTAWLTLSSTQSQVTGAGFSLASGMMSGVYPGMCTKILAQFDPTQPGAFTGNLRIVSNDPDENPYNIALSGTSVSNTPTAPQIHVQVQSVTRQGFLQVLAKDQVLVTDQNNHPVSGVRVTASYSGPTNGQVSGTTGSNGMVTLQTSSVRRPNGQWCFQITGLTKSGFIYNPAANTVTTVCG